MEQIRGTFDFSGDIHKNDRLYDEDEGAVSGSKIIKIMVNFADKVEGSLKDIRTLVDSIPESS